MLNTCAGENWIPCVEHRRKSPFDREFAAGKNGAINAV
jgi:hypothetical protein